MSDFDDRFQDMPAIPRFSDETSISKLQAQVEALQYENSKLRKTNAVLIQRVEMGWGNHSGAYRSFESAALLADKVKERTRQLQNTLKRLEEANQELALAQGSSEHSRQMLLDAIESIPESFVMFDAERRLVMANSGFLEFWEEAGVAIEFGVTRFADIQKQAVRLGLIDTSIRLREVASQANRDTNEVILRLSNDRWIQMSEHATAEGGLVVIYTDITSVKEGEELRHERALAEQARLLQSTLENMSHGVALVNSDHVLEAWNRRFLELCELERDDVVRGMDFPALLQKTELDYIPRPELNEPLQPGEMIFVGERTLQSGRVLMIRRHAIPGGGYLDTYADITSRFRNEEALRESERRIRLITDALPAMISYVNRELCYEFVNKSFEDWYCKPREQISGQSLHDMLGEQSYQLHRPYIEGALAGHTVNFEVSQSSGDRRNRDFRKTFIPHFGADRGVLGFFALEQDITEQRRTAQALQQAYEYMEQRVNERTREISSINLQLRKEIEERQLAEAGLIEAKKAADRANESKTRFLAAASHDLLQPMNAARLFVTALKDQSLCSEADHLVNSLGYSLENVESLISSLVDISKLEAGVVEAVKENFHLGDLLHRLVTEFKPQAQKAGLSLDFVNCQAIVYSDSQLLARILRNLLTNAVRYTQKGRLLLGCRRRISGIEVQIWDTGIGIPSDKLGEIFQEFSRIDARQKRSDKGLGLGLAIVDRISRVLGHTTQVQSWIGKGSCFSVTLPYGREVKPQTTESVPLDILGQPLRNSRILVVDNDPDICDGMRALLSNWDCDVLTLETLEQLQQDDELLEFDPQLVIADYHLDDGDTGLDAIGIINERLERRIPVVLITANYTNELRQIARDAGYQLMNKPVKPLKLKVLLSNILTSGHVS